MHTMILHSLHCIFLDCKKSALTSISSIWKTPSFLKRLLTCRESTLPLKCRVILTPASWAGPHHYVHSKCFFNRTWRFLRRSNVKVVDVEARGRHSAQSGGDGEEGHSQGVVTAYISCCHQEHRRPDHPYRNNTVTSSEACRPFRKQTKIMTTPRFSCGTAGPYQQGRRTSWLWRWGRGRFPAGNRQAGHSAPPSQRSPCKEEPTVNRSGVDTRRQEHMMWIFLWSHYCAQIISVHPDLTLPISVCDGDLTCCMLNPSISFM